MSEKQSLTRSEIVRQRRRKHNWNAQTQVEHRTQVPRPLERRKRTEGKNRERGLPPITSRGVINNMAIDRHKKARKRGFNMTFAMPRPEIRALSHPRVQVRFGWRLLSSLLVLLLGASLYLLWTRPEFRVNGAQITGNQRISADQINSALGLEEALVFLLKPEQIREQTLESYPELAAVNVTVSLPNLLTIHVTERQPLILWVQDGEFAWIDETGVALLPYGEAEGLITVQALGSPPELSSAVDDLPGPRQFITRDTVWEIIALAPYVPGGRTLLYDPVTGLGWVDERGWQAVFGLGGSMETKVLVYHAMVDWLIQRGTQPVLINVAYPNAPFYRTGQIEEKVEEQ